MRQEFMQRRIEKTDGGRPSGKCLEDANKVFALIRKYLGERGLAVFLAVGKNHFAHRVDTVALKEHMFGTAKSDTAGPEGYRVAGLFGSIGIGAHAHTRGFRTPVHEPSEVLVGLT